MHRELATTVGDPLSVSEFWFAIAVTFVFALTILTGGATGKWFASDAISMILAGPLLVWGVLRLGKLRPRGPELCGFGLFAAIAAVQVIQLVPLPPSIWTALPGREPMAEVFSAAGQALGYMPLSVAPWATLYGLATLVVPAAVFVACLSLPAALLPRLIAVLSGVAAFNVLLGVAQIADGPDSALRFFTFTNVLQPVGIFANANHLAGFLAITIPFAVAQALSPDRSLAARWLFAGTALLSLAGCAATFSRAGALLALVAAAAGAATVLAAYGRRRHILASVAVVGVAGLVIFAQFGLAGLVRRMETVAPAESRLLMVEGAITAGFAYMPVGAGFGTTRTAYAMTETPDRLTTAVVNQVHNEYLQLWLEGGVPGLLLGLAVLAWIGWMASLRLRGSGAAGSIAPAACILIVLLHSTVDYPLRTLAIQACTALALAMLARPPAPSRRSRRASTTRGPG
jgi:O-antigen ligase